MLYLKLNAYVWYWGLKLVDYLIYAGVTKNTTTLFRCCWRLMAIFELAGRTALWHSALSCISFFTHVTSISPLLPLNSNWALSSSPSQFWQQSSTHISSHYPSFTPSSTSHTICKNTLITTITYINTSQQLHIYILTIAKELIFCQRALKLAKEHKN